MRRWLAVALLVALTLLTLGSFTSAQAVSTDPQPTVVSFTFDDTLASQRLALDVLQSNDMPATLYVNSSRISKDEDYLSYEDLKRYQEHGFEIGGHTISHPDLTTLTTTQMRHEICDDRASLLDMGFRVSNFAYPLGSQNMKVQKVVKSCGYNSARALPGLRSPGYGCNLDCPTAETIPVNDPWVIRTPTTIRPSTTLAEMKQYVTQAEQDQGGLVPLVFHRICVAHCATTDSAGNNSVSLSIFIAFVDWLAKRPTTTMVAPIRTVVGDQVKPAVGEVQDYGNVVAANTGVSSTPAHSARPSTPDSAQAAFTVGSIRVNQTLIMILGIVIALTFVVTYRIATKGDRYVRRHP